MPSHSTDNELFLEYALRLTRYRLRLVTLGVAVLATLAVVLAEMTALVLADHWLNNGSAQTGLPPAALLAGRWVMLVTAVGMLIWLVAIPISRRLNSLHLARLIEIAHPEFRNDLTSALQLAEDSKLHPGILAAVRRRASGEVAQADVDSAVRTRGLGIASIMAGAVVVAFVTYGLISPKSVLQSFTRVLGGSAPAPTWTEILSVQPSSGTRVLLGDPVTFEAEIRQPQAEVRVEVSRDGGITYLADDCLAMSSTTAGIGRLQTFERRWPATSAGAGQLWFRIRAGDALSDARELQVLPTPAVVNAELSIVWPAYTGRPRTVVSGRRVEALAGSTLKVSAQANVPLERGSLAFDRAPAVSMEVSAEDPHWLTGLAEVVTDSRFRIVLTDTYGHPGTEQVAYELKVLADVPPRIARSAPASDVKLAVNDVLPISGEASDDFGLAEVTLNWQSPAGSGSKPLAKFAAPGRLVAPVELKLPASQLGQPGQTIRCWLAAKDFRPPAGQVGQGEPFFVTIAAPDQQLLAQAQQDQQAAENHPPVDPAEGQADSGGAEPTSAMAGSATAAAMANAASQPAPGAQSDKQLIQQELLQLAKADQAVLDRLAQQEARNPETQKSDPAALADTPPKAGGADQPPAADPGNPAQAQAGPQNADAQPAKAGNPSKPGEAGPDNKPQPAKAQPSGTQPASKPAGDQNNNNDASPPGPKPPADPDIITEPDTGSPAGAKPANAADKPGQGQPDQNSQPGQQPSANPSGAKADPGQPAGQGSQAQPANANQQSGNAQQAQAADKGQGEGQGKGQGEGQGKGQGEGQGKGQGEGQGKGQGQGQGQGQGMAGNSPGGGGEAGGDPNAGASDQRPEVKVDPLAPSPIDTTPQLAGIDRLMRQAQEQIVGNKVDPQLLQDLNMTPEQFRDFVRKYTERLDRLAPLPARNLRPARISPDTARRAGTAAVKSGNTDLGNFSGSPQLSQDDLSKRAAARPKVAEAYRSLVSAYFIAIGQGEPTSQPK